MPTTLVTGGAGFIGSHIVEALLARGDDVRVIDDLSTGRLENLSAVRDRITFIEGSIENPALVREAMQSARWVLHEAAMASVPQSIDDPLRANSVNITGTLNVLEEARRAGVERVVLAASCAAYGDRPELPSRETDLPAPISPYTVTKVTTEMYAAVYSREMGLPVVALRYFNVFGPRQDPQGPYAAVIPKFIEAHLAGTRPTIFGTGEQTRDFIYVGDIVRANLLALEAPTAPGNVYNIGSGEGRSLLDLAAALRASFGPSFTVEHAPTRAGDVMHSRGDISRAQRDLGFEPQVTFAEGLARTVEYTTRAADRAGAEDGGQQ